MSVLRLCAGPVSSASPICGDLLGAVYPVLRAVDPRCFTVAAWDVFASRRSVYEAERARFQLAAIATRPFAAKPPPPPLSKRRARNVVGLRRVDARWLAGVLETPNGDDPPTPPWTERRHFREEVKAIVRVQLREALTTINRA